MHLNLLLNSAVSLDRSPSPGSLPSHWLPGWVTCPTSLAPLILKVLLIAIRKVKSLRVKVKYRKEVGHLTKSVGHTHHMLVDHL